MDRGMGHPCGTLAAIAHVACHTQRFYRLAVASRGGACPLTPCFQSDSRSVIGVRGYNQAKLTAHLACINRAGCMRFPGYRGRGTTLQFA
jgi:hypothetical protein